MRTSRISRDTSKALSSPSHRAQCPPRQTRSGSHAALQDFALNTGDAPRVASNGTRELVSTRDSGDHESDGATSTASRKRKRGQHPPSVTGIKRGTKETSTTDAASPGKSIARPKRARRAPAKKKVAADGTLKVEPPPNWEEVYALTREMRNENVAPVDTMGCESLADRQRTPRDQRFQTLVALMLSSQTKDTVTAVAIRGMQEDMPGVRDSSTSYEATLTRLGLQP